MVPSYFDPSYFDLMHAQKIDYQLVDKATRNDQITSSCSSSSPANYNVNGQICNDKKPNEVWEEVDNRVQNNIITTFYQRQSENTIEDFLVKAGGLTLMPSMTVDPTVLYDRSSLQVMQQQHVTIPIPNDVAGNDLSIMPSIMVPVVNMFLDNEVDRKVICSSYQEAMMEKTVEKKRNRMIKNRESAARSRARKQAHTNQLELKVLEWKKTNNKLKKYKRLSAFQTSSMDPRPSLG